MGESPRRWTKDEMHSRMQQGLSQLLDVLDLFSDDQMLSPRDSVGWNIRDHVTHLTVWAEGIAALLRREDRWKAMGLAIDDSADELDYDSVNAQIAEAHKHVSPAQARASLIAAHQQVLSAMEALTEEDLAAPYERFVAPYTGHQGQPVTEYILGNTADHYDEHTAWMRAIVPTSTTSGDP